MVNIFNFSFSIGISPFKLKIAIPKFMPILVVKSYTNLQKRIKIETLRLYINISTIQNEFLLLLTPFIWSEKNAK